MINTLLVVILIFLPLLVITPVLIGEKLRRPLEISECDENMGPWLGGPFA